MGEVIEYCKNNEEVRKQMKYEVCEYRKQNLVTQAKKGEELVAIMPAIKEAMNIMRDDIFDLGTENEILKERMGNVDEVWLQETKFDIISNSSTSKKNEYLLDRMKRRSVKVKELL